MLPLHDEYRQEKTRAGSPPHLRFSATFLRFTTDVEGEGEGGDFIHDSQASFNVLESGTEALC